jgi:hypothetical protein
MESINGAAYYFKNDFYKFTLPQQQLISMDGDVFNKYIDGIGPEITAAKERQAEANRQAEQAKREQEEANRKEAEQRAQEQREQAPKAEAIFNDRQNSLINLGMRIVGDSFIKRNEFGDDFSIHINRVSISSEEQWPELLAQFEKGIFDLNSTTENKRREIQEKEEARKPEIQKVREYLAAILNQPKPEINDPELKKIMHFLNFEITSIIGQANEVLKSFEK